MNKENDEMRKYLQSLLDLKENADFEKTKETISKGVSLQGYNFWILICSTILASIGLDTNSTAVIIGAMLISPLMSPILGVGLSLAIHDKQLLSRAARDLLLAMLIALSVSILYFFLSPLGEPTPELQARTFPTLLDVLIALFGGIAGIVSISRHDQTNAIPGVAIATALMPPLCTAGFGIATFHWNYFLGAFYLFFINAVFISLSTYIIVRYLHFPEKEFLNKRLQTQYKIWFGIAGIIIMVPSIYFLYSVYKKEVIKNDINQLVISPIQKQGNEILKWELVDKDTSTLIKVYHSGRALSDSLKKSIDSTLLTHKMATYHLVPMRINLTKDEVSQLSAEMAKQMFQEMQLDQIDSKKQIADTLSYLQLAKEARAAFTFIDTLYQGWVTMPDTTSKIDTIPIVFYKTNKTKKYVSKSQRNQLYQFLKIRLQKDSLIIVQK